MKETEQNAFITAFLDDEDEQFHTVSIRMSVIELIEDLFMGGQIPKFSRQELQEILKQFFFSKLPDVTKATPEKLNFIHQT